MITLKIVLDSIHVIGDITCEARKAYALISQFSLAFDSPGYAIGRVQIEVIHHE